MDLLVSSYGSSEYKKDGERMVNMMLPSFKANDIDQELKQTIVITVGNLLKNMGHVISSKSLSAIFGIYLDKTANENLRTLIFNWLTKAVTDNPELKADIYLSKFMNSLLENLYKNKVILQRQTLDLLTAITRYQPKALSGYDETLAKSLVNLLTENNLSLFNVTFDLLSLLAIGGFAYSKNQSLLASSVDATIRSFDLDDNESNFQSALKFLENAISFNCVNNKTLMDYVAQILKFKQFNISKAKVVAILASKIGNAPDLIVDLEKQVRTLLICIALLHKLPKLLNSNS